MSKYIVTDRNGQKVAQGDTVTSFRGEGATFVSVSRGVEYNGTAKVIVSWGQGARREYYADVFDLTVQTVEGN
jgi:hypothetical protein